MKARGHQAILLDVYLGLEFNEPVTKGLFEKDIDWAKDIRAVSESHPDLSRLKEQRKDGGRSMFGPNVLALCEPPPWSAPWGEWGRHTPESHDRGG